MISCLDPYRSSTAESGPLFVIGMWRSGTSLLYSLLNQHPQIALLYEGDLPLLRPLFSRIMFCGFRSRWMTPTLCAAANAFGSDATVTST